MAIQFQTESHQTALAGTTVVTKPTGTVDGDLLIVFVGSNARTETVNSVPSGWTLIVSDDSAAANNAILYTYYKIASSEGASWTWGWTGSTANKGWGALRFDTFQTASPINTSAIGQDTNDGTANYTNTITPTVDNCMLVMIALAKDNSTTGASGYAITTSNPTWTERIDADLGTNTTIVAATAIRPQTTATGDSFINWGTDEGTEDSQCAIIAINRITDFSANLTDTVTLTETLSVVTAYTANPTDTVTLTDTLLAEKKKQYTNTAKSSSTWLNQDKS